MDASSAKVVWDDLFERFNKMDGSRTFNLHKEIATLSQGPVLYQFTTLNSRGCGKSLKLKSHHHVVLVRVQGNTYQ